MALGLGSSSIGNSPYGLGTPAPGFKPAGLALIDFAGSGLQDGARYIDPITGLFSVDQYGQFRGMTPAQQQVYLSVKTDVQTAIPVTLGHDLKSIQDIGPNFVAQVQAIISKSLVRLTSAKIISIQSISVEQVKPTGALIHIQWTDLTTGVVQTTTI